VLILVILPLPSTLSLCPLPTCCTWISPVTQLHLNALFPLPTCLNSFSSLFITSSFINWPNHLPYFPIAAYCWTYTPKQEGPHVAIPSTSVQLVDNVLMLSKFVMVPQTVKMVQMRLIVVSIYENSSINWLSWAFISHHHDHHLTACQSIHRLPETFHGQCGDNSGGIYMGVYSICIE